ncbi:NLR family CARD domain-containing protein 4-like [Antedon mediterranea]|uniref:NLR family CARD domain-containing protein 4-like n=1 Tax=Antedon mediterranea TaxID=105859 RepID=UPI003AF622D7
MLFPMKGKADIKKLDITLLFMLIKHLCVFKDNMVDESKWNEMPGNSELANIVRLKNFRNAKAHPDCCRISPADFNNEWIRLSKMLQILGVDKKVIDLYASKDISVTDQQKVIEEIRELEEELKEIVGGIQRELQTISSVTKQNESAIRDVLDGQEDVKTSMRTLKDQMDALKSTDKQQFETRLTQPTNSTPILTLNTGLFKETCSQLNYKVSSPEKVDPDKLNIDKLFTPDTNQHVDRKESNAIQKKYINSSAESYKVATRTTSAAEGQDTVHDIGRVQDELDLKGSLALLVRGQQNTQVVVQNLTNTVGSLEEKIEHVFPSAPHHRVECEDDALQLCFNAVKQNYLQTRNQIQLLPWDRSDIVSMDTLFTNLTLVVDLLEPNEQLKIPLKSYHDMFRNDTSSGVPITRVLGYGRAGIGKSTLINKMAYDWAKGNSDSPIKRFKLVVALSMQKISPDENVVEALFKHGILTREHLIYKDILNRFVEQKPGEVAVLLDACDEYKPQSIDSPENGEILKLLENKHLRSSFVVVTSRPWRVEEFKEHRGIYLHCELQGFSKKNVEIYVEKFFQRDAARGKALTKYLHSNGLINGIATLPMMTKILCWLWKDNASMKLPETLSELYQKLLDYMFKRHLDKDSDNTEQLTKYLNKVVKIIGRVGLDGLFNNRTLTFRESDFDVSSQLEDTTSKNVVAISCKIGLLMRDTVSGNVAYKEPEDEDTDSDDDCYFSTTQLKDSMKPEVGVLFFHKTAQEKCAAMYAAKLARRKPEEFQSLYLDRIATAKDALQFEMLLLFLSGEHRKVAKLVLTHLLEIFEKELSVNSDSYVSGRLSFEGSMRYQEYVELIIRCYHESKCCGSLNDIMVQIFKHRHIRFSNFSPTTANSLGYLLKYSEAQEDQTRINANLNIHKIEMMNISIQTNKEISTLWEMFPDDQQEFIRKVKKYSQMPIEKLRRKLRECRVETLPPAFRHFPEYQCLSFMRTFQVIHEHGGDDTDITPVVSSLQNVNLEKITILGFDISSMADVLPNALRKSTLTVINLSSANIGPEICRTVAKSLKKTHSLKELILKNNPIGDGIGFLAEYFKYVTKLTNLNVSYSPVTEQGMVILSQNLHELQQMEKLSIYQLFDAASESFAQGIQNMNALELITLPLQGLSSSEAFRIVQRACQCPQMVELKITDMTSNCDLMVSCAADNLIEMPYLKIVSLYGKRDEGRVEIIKKECTITNGACNAVIRMLRRIGSLERLQIVSLWMPKEGLEEVAMACEDHHNLKTFRYSGECVPPGIDINNFKKIELY